MSECKASRRLVKSPPELWSEVSSAASLNRHMDQFGEIRITRLEPETAVAWEGEHARGTVRLEPSGWGTRVSLTAEMIDGAARGVEPEAAGPAGERLGAAAVEAAGPAGQHAHAAAVEAPFEAVEAEMRELSAFVHRSRREAEQRRWRRRLARAVKRWFAREPEPVAALEDSPARAATSVATPQPEPAASAALNAVLDSLGQAHHRPFSRP